MLLIDEIDMLIGDSLLAVLRQLRTGYHQRPRSFPQSVVLCGVRDVRDYRIHSGSANAIIAGGSAFNVKAESLRLGDFSRDEVLALLGQHTAETGQAFTAEALELVWGQTLGQPWLVNALADDACFRDKAGRDRSRPIDAAALRAAQERLILRRETHLDQLADKLREDRVRRVVEPLLSGAEVRTFTDRDLEYIRDLGLLARDRPVRIANPIYAEVVPRELTWVVQEEFDQETAWYVDADGGLNVRALLAAFQTFFREHSEHWSKRFQYQEAWPQLLLQAFLQRVVNSGGRIEREYGLGRGRTDLLIVWPRGFRASDRGPRDGPSHGRRRGGRARRQGRDRVQGAVRQPGTDHRGGPGADGGLHGPVRGAGRAPRDHRPGRRGPELGREGVSPPEDIASGCRHRRLGHVTRRRRSQCPDHVLSATWAVRESSRVPCTIRNTGNPLNRSCSTAHRRPGTRRRRNTSSRTASPSSGSFATAATRRSGRSTSACSSTACRSSPSNLKNSLTKQTAADAVEQYRKDRNPREKLFEFGRCVAHFAVDESEALFCTHLKGKAAWFLPFNRGWNDGAGNPPNPSGIKADYLWRQVLARESLTNILENYAQVVEAKDEKTGKKKRLQIG